jgi:hypothetical protein
MAKSAVDWAGHVLAWRGSGLSQAAYARLHGIQGGALSAQACKAAAVGAACAPPGALITLRHAGGWSIDSPVQWHASVLAWAAAL